MPNDEFEIAVGELDVESPAGVLDIDDSMQTDDDDYDLSSALDPLLQLMPDNTRALVDLSLRNSGIGPDDPVRGMIIAQTIAIDCVARDAVREAMDKIEIAAPDANYKFPIEEFEDQIRKTMVSQSVNFGEQIEKISTVIAKGAADYQRNLTEINLALQALKKSVDDLPQMLAVSVASSMTAHSAKIQTGENSKSTFRWVVIAILAAAAAKFFFGF